MKQPAIIDDKAVMEKPALIWFVIGALIVIAVMFLCVYYGLGGVGG